MQPDADPLAAAYTAQFIHSCTLLAGGVVLLWDFVITISQEVRFIWYRPKSRSSLLYFLNRYLSVFGALCVVTMEFAPSNGMSCTAYTIFRQILLVLSEFVIYWLMTLRIYALLRCDKRVLLAYIVWGALGSAAALWAVFTQEIQAAPHFQCLTGHAFISGLKLSIPWWAVAIADIVVFAVILTKGRSQFAERSLPGFDRAQSETPNVFDIILRDGVICFGAMFVINILNILTFYFGGLYLQGALSTPASCLSAALMSRLSLNLHEVSSHGILDSSIGGGITWREPTELSSFRFSVIRESDTGEEVTRVSDTIQD